MPSSGKKVWFCAVALRDACREPSAVLALRLAARTVLFRDSDASKVPGNQGLMMSDSNSEDTPQDKLEGAANGEPLTDVAHAGKKRRSLVPPPPPPPSGGLFKEQQGPDASARRSAPPPPPRSRASGPPKPPASRGRVPRPPPSGGTATSFPPSSRGGAGLPEVAAPAGATRPAMGRQVQDAGEDIPSAPETPAAKRELTLGRASTAPPVEPFGVELAAEAVGVAPQATAPVLPPQEREAARTSEFGFASEDSATPEHATPVNAVPSSPRSAAEPPSAPEAPVLTSAAELSSPLAAPEPPRRVPAVSSVAVGYTAPAVMPPAPPAPSAPVASFPFSASAETASVQPAEGRSTMISEAPPPVALEPAGATRPRRRKPWGWFVGAVALMAGGALGAVALSEFSSVGALVITVEGPGHTPVDQVKVFVDGELSCTASPCRLRDLEAGVRTVKVTAPGYLRRAEFPVEILAGKDRSQSIQLVPEPVERKVLAVVAQQAQAPGTPPALEGKKGVTPEGAASSGSAPKEEVLSLSDLSKATDKAAEEAKEKAAEEAKEKAKQKSARKRAVRKASVKRSRKSRSTAKAKKKVKSPAATTLRLSTIPVSKIVVDGKPIGSTPQVITVSPGEHSIVFISAKGRETRRVSVGKGETKVVSVRF